MMTRIICFLVIAALAVPANAATSRMGLQTTTTTRAATQTASPTAAYNYNYMYPYLNNQMKTDLNPGVTPSQGSNPISVITRTEKLSSDRRVVPRSAKKTNATAARAATATNNAQRGAARTSPTMSSATPQNNTQRRVVARAGTRNATMRSARSDASTTQQNINNAGDTAYTNTGTAISSARCLADYTECMNGYCARTNTAYNRCYCSAKLAQIDSQYQPAIDALIKQILQMQSTNTWSAEEMNQYWASTIGKYTGQDANNNSWVNLDNALNINWADMESRVRGAQAFATGHEYCVQHLRGCAYMASNLRDAYRSEISRDCASYESGLMKIKNAAESIVEAYSD